MSWMYTFFKSDKRLFDMYAEPFVKLMLDMDLNAFLEWQDCQQNMLELFENLNKYKQKLPLEVQRFFLQKLVGKINFVK